MFTKRNHDLAKDRRQTNRNILHEITSAYMKIGRKREY